ncbi:MAG: sugar ABC transporter substrate-binding protein, partial [Armatimonadetes bacterium]|nr:sugar ABC transporter substrate-binding protein [Armatimonadota bacterium]
MAKRLALVLVLAVAGGCGADPYAGKIKLRYMAWGNPEQLKLEEELCAEFNHQNPDLHVTFIKVPNSAYANKAVVMFASRTAPDVVRIDHYEFPRLVRKGYFYNLKPLADTDPEFKYADYVDLAIDEAKYQGGWYGANTMYGAELIYYNKTMVRAAGLEDPYVLHKRGEWTWDKFREYALAMTKVDKSGRTVQFGCEIPLFPMETPVLWAFGGAMLSDDQSHVLVGSPGTIKAYEFLAGLRWKDKVAPTPAQASNAGYTFEGGQIGMVLNWSGMTPRYRAAAKGFEWDVCPLPTGPAGGKSMVKGNQLVVAKESKHPAEAWRFVKFLTSDATERKLYIENR